MLCSVMESVYQITSQNSWSDSAITFSSNRDALRCGSVPNSANPEYKDFLAKWLPVRNKSHYIYKYILYTTTLLKKILMVRADGQGSGHLFGHKHNRLLYCHHCAGRGESRSGE